MSVFPSLLAALAGALSCAASAAPPSPQPALELVERPAEDVLVLGLVLDRWILDDALLAYADPGDVLLPLAEVASALDFAVTVDPAAGQAEGWFLAETRRFALDVARRQVLVEGKPGPFEASQVELHADDIYVGSRLLSRWWPVALEVDLARMEVRVRPREKLPVELRREREARHRSVLARRPGPGGRLEAREMPYRAVSWPLLDGRLQASASRSGGETRAESRLDLIATGDLAGMGADLFVSGLRGREPEAARTQARLRLGRQDPEGRLLGALGARGVFVGDLLVPDRPLVSRGLGALGFEVSSFPLDRLSQPHRTDVRGDALPGWEVELYRNDELLDFQRVGPDGHYAFDRVPLVQGLNLLRLIFYGPQEERREEVRRLFVEPGSRPPGGLHYRLALYEQGRELFPRGDRIAEAAGGATRLFLEVETPVGAGFTLLSGLQSLTLEDGRHEYLSLEASRGAGPVFALVDLVGDRAGGWAGRTVLRTRLGGVDLSFEDNRFFDFVSEENRSRSDPARSRTSFLAQGRLGPVRGGTRRPGFTVEGEQERFHSGGQRDRWSTRLSVPSARLATTLSVEWEGLQDASGARRSRLDAGLLLSGTWRRFALRGAARYRLEPESDLTELSAAAARTLGAHTHLSFELERSLAGEPFTRYGVALSRRFPQCSLGGGVSHDDRGVLVADASLSFSLSREPQSRRWRARWQPMARRGSASVRVFLDRDADGRMDEGEPPLAGVRLTRDGFATDTVTDGHGLALLAGLPVYRAVDVGLVAGSLEDPFWWPASPGVGLRPRPGRVARVDLGVVVTGEIDGTVALRRGEVEVGAAKVKVELVDESGEVLRWEETSFDGYYLFASVLPGRYSVRVEARQLERRGLAAPAAMEVVILGEGSTVSGVDFVLQG